MNRVGLASLTVLGTLAVSTFSAAQAGEPPPPPPPPPPPAATAPPPPAPPPAAAPAPSAAASAAPAPDAAAQPPVAPTTVAPAAAAANGEATANVTAAGDGTAEGEDPAAGLSEQWRKDSLRLQTGINGSTGLMHVSQAGSGAPGTFRFSILTGFYSGSGFLCNSASPCPVLRAGDSPTTADDVSAMSAHVAVSATILPFLEGYIGFHNRATSNSRSRPQLLEVLGDANIGVKAFMPAAPDQLFFFGGEAELWLLNGTGMVGLDGAGTSFVLRGLATIDPNNRINPEDRIPLRGHMNLGWRFDNSAALVEQLEHQQPPEGRGQNITRIERFGLGINRVDFFQMGFGAEYVHPIIRPFVEWSMDVPVNARQDYICNIDQANAHGESCLKLEEGAAIAPSRLTLGAKLFPWEGRGLGLLAAFDIATSASSTFIDETAPELPWKLWLGVGWSVDTEPPKPVIKTVKAEVPITAPPIQRFVQGTVLEKGTQTPVPNALVRYDGRHLTGMISDSAGWFRTIDLTPGTYTFNISAPGYRDGQCSITISESVAPSTVAPAAPAPGEPAQPAAPAAPSTTNNIVVPVQCELESLPKLGTIVGALTDGESNGAVAGARIRATDRKNRELELAGDAAGTFRITNIPPGRLKLTIEASGYFTTTTEVDVKALEELQTRIVLNKRPAQPNVVVQGREVKLKKQVHFATDSADIMPDSMSLLEEIADVLAQHTEITAIEVQGHTDNTGTPPHNLRLSQERAQAVVDALVRLRVDPSRLTAKGYGQEKPIAPNVAEVGRARNRRVQLMIQGK